MVKNNEIDLWKFIFSIIIVLLHSFSLFNNQFLYMPGGSIGVDFFFLVSGYFMLQSINKRTNVQNGGAFIWHKLKKVLPYFYISCLIAFVLRTIFDIDGGVMLHKVLLLINELLLLQAAGFNVYAVTGSAWYLSAMFIAIAILYPMATKYQDTFLNIISPVIAILILGSLSAAYGNTSNPGYMIQGFLFLGLLKAIAEIALGCFLYRVVEIFNSVQISGKQKYIYTVLKYFLILFVIYFASRKDSNSIILMSCVPCLFIGLMLTFSNQCYRIPQSVSKISDYLGELSIAIYLNNFYVALIVAKLFPWMTNNQKLGIYLVGVLVIADMVLYVVKWVRR